MSVESRVVDASVSVERTPSISGDFTVDGTYQSIPMSADSLHETLALWFRSQMSHARDLPDLIVACGRCRVGSTALTNAFGMSGIPALSQPIKSCLRHVVHGSSPTHDLRRLLSGQRRVFMKEIFGPFADAECRFNPIRVLLDAGYPGDRIKVIGLDRNTLESFSSWKEKWGAVLRSERLLENFIASSRQTEIVRDYCEANGVRFIPFHYEWIESLPRALGYLERNLSLEAGALAAATGPWGNQGNLTWGADKHTVRPASAIHYFGVPAAFRPVNVHSNRDAYRYSSRAVDNVASDEMESLRKAGLLSMARPVMEEGLVPG